MLRVSRNTVRSALKEFEQQQLLHRVQGKGTFVAEAIGDRLPVRAASFALVVLDVVSRYYREFFAAFERFATQVEQVNPVILCDSRNDVNRQGNQILGLIHQQVAGVVLNPLSIAVTPPFHVSMFQQAGIPVVLLHRAVPYAAAPVLEIPATEVGRCAGRLFVEAGHRRAAFFASHRAGTGEQLLAGLRDELSRGGGELPDDRVDFGTMADFTSADLERYWAHADSVIQRLLSSDTPPTALFVSSAEDAEHMYLAVMRLGLRVPEDLSIVCFGGAHQSGAIMRRLTTITLDECDAAQKAVDLLVEMRRGLRPLTSRDVFPLSLGFCAGETLGAPRT